MDFKVLISIVLLFLLSCARRWSGYIKVFSGLEFETEFSRFPASVSSGENFKTVFVSFSAENSCIFRLYPGTQISIAEAFFDGKSFQVRLKDFSGTFLVRLKGCNLFLKKISLSDGFFRVSKGKIEVFEGKVEVEGIEVREGWGFDMLKKRKYVLPPPPRFVIVAGCPAGFEKKCKTKKFSFLWEKVPKAKTYFFEVVSGAQDLLISPTLLFIKTRENKFSKDFQKLKILGDIFVVLWYEDWEGKGSLLTVRRLELW